MCPLNTAAIWPDMNIHINKDRYQTREIGYVLSKKQRRWRQRGKKLKGKERKENK